MANKYSTSKTKFGKAYRAYSGMLNRINGCVKKHAHIYKGLEIVDREDFIEWALEDREFNRIFELWELSGFVRTETPSIDRIDGSKGYIWGNMQWLTLSDNSRKAKHIVRPRTFVKRDRRKPKMTEVIQVRLSYYEKNFIQGLADLYAQGNVSLFMVYSAFNSDRKMLSEDDLRESNRSIRKGRRSAP